MYLVLAAALVVVALGLIKRALAPIEALVHALAAAAAVVLTLVVALILLIAGAMTSLYG